MVHTTEGTIRLLAADHETTGAAITAASEELEIHIIEVKPDLRRQGICTRFVSQLVTSRRFTQITFCNVQSATLKRILKPAAFKCQGFGDFVWTRL
jgi:N-acetylglutamate synthase-like GNAT family acetyltransferase